NALLSAVGPALVLVWAVGVLARCALPGPLGESPPAATPSHDTHCPAASDTLVELDDTGPLPLVRPTSPVTVLVPCPPPTPTARLTDNSSFHTPDRHNTPAQP